MMRCPIRGAVKRCPSREAVTNRDEVSDGITVLQIHCLTVLWWGNFEVIVNEDWRMGESEVSLRAVSNRITVGL